MESVRSFLESSTIHGLVYISRPGKLSRLIWILVVIAGFSGAGVMIYQSFQSWAESPVKTTIETLPITEITLPKVTVCPPKNTFTNLNYDLMMLENMTLDNDTREELTQFAVGLIQDHVHGELMANISKFEEENRYYNWYMGYTKIQLPYWGVQLGCTETTTCLDSKLRYKVDTFATSGSVSTQYFKQKFDADNIEKYFKYFTYINPPSNYKDHNNITLYIEVEKNIQQELDEFYSDNELDTVSTLNRTESPPGSFKWYVLRRDISEDAVKDLQMDHMPGFRLTWYYNQELEPHSINSASAQYQYVSEDEDTHTARTEQFSRSSMLNKFTHFH